IVLGLVALGSAWIATLASVVVFGWLMIFGGAAEAVTAFWAKEWSGLFLHLLVGFLYLVGGFLIIGNPVASAAGLTILLAALFLTRGLFRLMAARVLRYPTWIWSVLDGVVTLILGVMIWSQWPASALWVIGTFLGIDLIFRGWAWVMFGFGAKQIPSATEVLGHAART